MHGSCGRNADVRFYLPARGDLGGFHYIRIGSRCEPMPARRAWVIAARAQDDRCVPLARRVEHVAGFAA